jgi:hypothetical protein
MARVKMHILEGTPYLRRCYLKLRWWFNGLEIVRFIKRNTVWRIAEYKRNHDALHKASSILIGNTAVYRFNYKLPYLRKVGKNRYVWKRK